LDRASGGGGSSSDYSLTGEPSTQRHCFSAGAEGGGVERGLSPRSASGDRDHLKDSPPVGMGRGARLPAREEHLACVVQEAYFDEGGEHVAGVISPSSPRSGLSQPPLDMGERERDLLDVAAPPVPAIRDDALEHCHGVALELRPVRSVREEAHALHGAVNPSAHTTASEATGASRLRTSCGLSEEAAAAMADSETGHFQRFLSVGAPRFELGTSSPPDCSGVWRAVVGGGGVVSSSPNPSKSVHTSTIARGAIPANKPKRCSLFGVSGRVAMAFGNRSYTRGSALASS
jgi:hypothetical protein